MDSVAVETEPDQSVRTVGHVIAESLAAHGVDRLFCVPGESYLGLLDALYGHPEIETVVCRHESGAGFMAVADARLTGRPGVACVSRGPGASNAAIAVHAAQQDAAPLILIVGQVDSKDLRKQGFQEIDYQQMFGSIAKWTTEITDASRTAETMLRAFQIATTGVPGPVVIAVPEDLLVMRCANEAVRPQAPISSDPSAAALAELKRLLTEAQRPIVIAGSGVATQADRTELLAFLEAWQLPSVVTFRRHDLLPNKHPLYAGDMGLKNPDRQMAVLEKADLVLVLGGRLGDITTQNYTFPHPVRPTQTLVHVHPDPTAIGTQFASDLSIGCTPAALFRTIGAPEKSLPDRSAWQHELKSEQVRVSALQIMTAADGVPFELVVHAVGQELSEDAVVTVDAGSFGAPTYRVIPFRPPQRLLAPISGSMGFGVPAAVATGLRYPGRQVVCFVGDGGLLMTGSELAVAKEHQLPIKVVVAENGIYGSIRIDQEKSFPGRTIGTSFSNPDLAMLGQAYGFAVTRIEREDEVPLAAAAVRRSGPQMIIVTASVRAVLPKTATTSSGTEGV